MRCWGIQGWTNLARAARLFECSMVVSISPFIWMWQANHTAFLESEFLMKCRKNRKGMERFCSTTIPTFRCLIHHAPKLATRHGSIGLHRLHAKCPKNQLSHMLHNCVDNIYIYSLLYIYIYIHLNIHMIWLRHGWTIWYDMIYIYIFTTMENPMSFFAGPATWRKREGPKMKYCLKAWFRADLGHIPMVLTWIEHWTNKYGDSVGFFVADLWH